jgi:hypothetical protein
VGARWSRCRPRVIRASIHGDDGVNVAHDAGLW